MNNADRTQWFDKTIDVHYVFDSNNVLERVHYSASPAIGIPLVKDRPDMQYNPSGSKKKKINYLSNKDLMVEFLKSREADRMTPKFAQMMELLVYRFSLKHNWKGYTYLECMRSEALVTICANWRSFKPEKSDNLFSYYTQVSTNAFIGVLNKEKRHRTIRDQLITQQGGDGSFAYQEGDE